MLVNIFLLIFTGTVLAMIFLCYIRGGMEPLLVMFFIGGLGITTMLFLGFLNTEDQEEINYSDTKYDKVHLNLNQSKVSFINKP